MFLVGHLFINKAWPANFQSKSENETHEIIGVDDVCEDSHGPLASSL